MLAFTSADAVESAQGRWHKAMLPLLLPKSAGTKAFLGGRWPDKWFWAGQPGKEGGDGANRPPRLCNCYNRGGWIEPLYDRNLVPIASGRLLKLTELFAAANGLCGLIWTHFLGTTVFWQKQEVSRELLQALENRSGKLHVVLWTSEASQMQLEQGFTASASHHRT